jgi:hypothetical protein
MSCNEADAARSAHLEGKKMAIKIKNKNKKIVTFIILKKNLAFRRIKKKENNIAIFL